MGTFINVSKAKPCPICGKTDWCSLLIPDEAMYPGQEMAICRRINESEIISPTNGNTYYFIKELGDDSVLYSDVETQSKKDGRKNYHPAHPPRKPKKAKPDVEPLSNEELHSIYADFLSLLSLESRHRRKFFDEGWSKEMIIRSSIKTFRFPYVQDKDTGKWSDQDARKKLTAKLMKNHPSLLGVPGFYEDTDGKWTFVGKQGLIIPVYDTRSNIYRLRVRLDKPEVDENGKEEKKYKNFSSYFERIENNTVYNIFKNGCRSGSRASVYFNPDVDDTSICYITEGEKKAFVINHFLKCITISLPGVGFYRKLSDQIYDGMSILDYLHSLDCSHVVIAYDADKCMVEQVLKAEGRLIELLKENNFHTDIANWNIGFGKGLDDILLLGVYPHLDPA